MIDPHKLQKTLCAAFCSTIQVTPVPCGYAVSSPFTDRSGDRIGFYLVEDADGYRLEDDGDYLARLVALGVDIESGTRGKLLSMILQCGGTNWDRDTLEIRTVSLDERDIVPRVIDFLSVLIRIRDIELITREVVRSTFREDAMAAIQERFAERAAIIENGPVDKEFLEFPSDAIIRPRDGKAAAIYFASTNEHIAEAQLLQAEADKVNRKDFAVIALIEDLALSTISRKKFQRAQNRGLTMPIFRGDEAAALTRIERELNLNRV